ncbi:hypothetical protein VMCG_02642 [Cytospora schulzeri]|uniref:F-box domain-containing protein n=1 Tax=Cytospora schulzeri TaxID=448051 RepID=A0A423X132_9PEZI|nr:hypothetical protein VMCG_02642 [Valsa malicola]
MDLLTQLPLEIVNHILSFVAPEDLARVNSVCWYLYRAVKDNSALFRAVYLNHLDPPPTKDCNWFQELKDLVKLKRICASTDPNKKKHLEFVYDTTTRLLQRSNSHGARPRLSVTYDAGPNTSILRDCFSTQSTIEAFLCQSFLFQRARAPVKNFASPKQPPDKTRQMSAKLHCLHGVPILQYGRTRGSKTYPFACSKVYDIREYTPRTRWGPFLDEGPWPIGSAGNEEGQEGVPEDRVDWEKVEAIMIVLWFNMTSKRLDHLPVFRHFWGVPFAGCWPNSYIPSPMNRRVTDLELEDPYDVTGTYVRVVCFLDYNDFFAYNFPPHDHLPDHLPRPALDEGEATRLIIMKIHVTKIEPPGPEDGQSLPVVYFEGFSRSLDSSWDENANSDLRGSVRLTREGEVRWTSFSLFGGQERWRSEGIQLGGVKSCKIVGNWFDKDYDPSGPCGPSAFWKIGDRHPSSDDDRITTYDFLPIVDGYENDLENGHGHTHENVEEEAGILEILQVNSDDEEWQQEEGGNDDEDDEPDSSAVEDEVEDLPSPEDDG